jgi:hypothetical protein
MKKTYVLLIPLLALISCKIAPPIAPSETNLLIGKWYYTQDTLRTYLNGVLQSSNNTGGMTFNRSNFTQFNADYTGATGNITGSVTTQVNFSYSMTANTVTFNTPSQPVAGYTIPASVATAAIKTLSATQLSLFYSNSSKDNNGNTILNTEAAYYNK